jgi:CRISPR-associated endonuclease/helicase Cas3
LHRIGPGEAMASFRLATAGTLTDVYPWQSFLYERLADANFDAGYLLLAPTGCGKTESVIIPSVGLQRGGAPRRVFIVAADGCPLDDYVERLGPYLRAFASSDGMPRTLYIDAADAGLDGIGIRFSADGKSESEISISPLEADVDVVLTTIGRFLDLFFGSGGVHGLPSALALPHEERIRRDLFFFDESHSYSPTRFCQFLKLVEFLFAEDTDIIVGSSTMPAGFEEELSFLEKVVSHAHASPVRMTYLAEDDSLAALAREAKARFTGRERLAVVVETAAQADALTKMIDPGLAHKAYYYQPGTHSLPRRRIYSELLSHDRHERPYILITTGPYMQSADLDLDVMLTTTCLPENLILRAGRCNRRQRHADGHMVVIGTSIDDPARTLNVAQQVAYLEALRRCWNTPFDPEAWKSFI